MKVNVREMEKQEHEKYGSHISCLCSLSPKSEHKYQSAAFSEANKLTVFPWLQLYSVLGKLMLMLMLKCVGDDEHHKHERHN